MEDEIRAPWRPVPWEDEARRAARVRMLLAKLMAEVPLEESDLFDAGCAPGWWVGKTAHPTSGKMGTGWAVHRRDPGCPWAATPVWEILTRTELVQWLRVTWAPEAEAWLRKLEQESRP